MVTVAVLEAYKFCKVYNGDAWLHLPSQISTHSDSTRFIYHGLTQVVHLRHDYLS